MSLYKNYYRSVIIYCEIEALSTFKHITGKKHAEFNLQIELHVHEETFSSICVFLGNTNVLTSLNKLSFALDFGATVM